MFIALLRFQPDESIYRNLKEISIVGNNSVTDMPVKGKPDKPPRVVVVRKITEYEAKLLFSVYKKHAEIVEQIDHGKTWKRTDVVGEE
ncbi:hypothetical protein ACFQ21_03565 [Ohtaekwangia kribbensis]|uniref:DUF1330 domain-containing protein n=2 Tax=Ohtaekwangia kribbensis TaxID=688913 RepID=A0ABW3JWL6_9BACT